MLIRNKFDNRGGARPGAGRKRARSAAPGEDGGGPRVAGQAPIRQAPQVEAPALQQPEDGEIAVENAGDHQANAVAGDPNENRPVAAIVPQTPPPDDEANGSGQQLEQVDAEPRFFAPDLQAHVDHGPPTEEEEEDEEVDEVDENFDEEPGLHQSTKDGIVEKYLRATVADIKIQFKNSTGDFYKQVTERGDMWHRPPDPTFDVWKKARAFRPDIRPDAFYYPDIFVWVPDMVFPGFVVNCMKCGCEAKDRGWSDARRVIGLHRHYYLLTRRHTCNHCNEDFRPTSPGYLATLPRHLQYLFPAVLTKRSAIDRLIVEQLGSFLDSGMPSNAIASMIRENHRRFYTETAVQYYSVVIDASAMPKQGEKIDNKTVPRFSPFDDRAGYNGFSPSGKLFRLLTL